VPAVVPAFHFASSLQAAGSLLCAYAVVRLAGRAARAVKRRPSPALALSLLVVLLARPLALYPVRADLARGRAQAEELGAREDWLQVRAWITAHAGERDVVLADPEPSLFIVGPTGRCVVAVEDVFANPYADQRARERARDRMSTRLRNGDEAGFRELARAFAVQWVITGPHQRVRTGLHPELQAGDLTLWRVP
jgi:hypothetical protein